jgi:hypothetical protein
VERAAASGRLLEVFGTGTACMIQPVVGLVKNDSEITVPFNGEATKHWLAKAPGTAASPAPLVEEPFSLCGRLTRALLDIQYGHVNSEWSVEIDP